MLKITYKGGNSHLSNIDNSTLKIIIDALEDKKAEEIKVIDISEISTIADYFVITNGTNRSQIQALSDSVEEKLAASGIHPKNIEGYNTANWILLDYNDILVHIFDKESRGFYDLERMWRDGKNIEI
jgi:ribosome-associated protein